MATLVTPRVQPDEKNFYDDSKSKGKHSAGSFIESVKTWVGDTAGAFDLMNTLKKVFDLFGNQFLLGQARGYIGGAAVPRLPGAVISLYQAVTKKDKVWTAHACADVLHQTTDVATTGSYFGAFFAKNPQPFLRAATYCAVANDTTDVAAFAVRLHDVCTTFPDSVKISPQLLSAVNNEKTFDILKLIKTVTAVFASVMALCTMILGAPLVPVAVTLTIAITSSVFSILSYYHKNYWSAYNLKADIHPLQLA